MICPLLFQTIEDVLLSKQFLIGYCSADSNCSLSNVNHFRQYKHDVILKSSQELKQEDNEPSETVSITSSNYSLSNVNHFCQYKHDVVLKSSQELKQEDNEPSETVSIPSTLSNENKDRKFLDTKDSNQSEQKKTPENCSFIKNTKTTTADFEITSSIKKSPQKLTQTSINDFFGGKKLVKKTIKPMTPLKGPYPAKKKDIDKSARKQTPKRQNVQKVCPFYKKIPGW